MTAAPVATSEEVISIRNSLLKPIKKDEQKVLTSRKSFLRRTQKVNEAIELIQIRMSLRLMDYSILMFVSTEQL